MQHSFIILEKVYSIGKAGLHAKYEKESIRRYPNMTLCLYDKTYEIYRN